MQNYINKMNKNFKNRTGEKYKTKEGYLVEIIEYFKNNNCTIQFNDGLIIYGKTYDDIKKGAIKNPHHPSTESIGFFGVGEYTAKRGEKFYRIWKGMIKRGYNSLYKDKYPTYKDVTVCNEWHNFQNFAQWMEQNYNSETMEGWHLDKDILVKGNKIYSPETCCFVPNEINILLTNNKNRRTSLPIGVRKSLKKFSVFISKVNRNTYIGTFNTPKEAFQAYKTAKELYIKEVADKWKEQIDPRVYEALINYKVEITD